MCERWRVRCRLVIAATMSSIIAQLVCKTCGPAQRQDGTSSLPPRPLVACTGSRSASRMSAGLVRHWPRLPPSFELRPVGRACGQPVACRSGLERAQVGYILPARASGFVLALHPVHYFVELAACQRWYCSRSAQPASRSPSVTWSSSASTRRRIPRGAVHPYCVVSLIQQAYLLYARPGGSPPERGVPMRVGISGTHGTGKTDAGPGVVRAPAGLHGGRRAVLPAGGSGLRIRIPAVAQRITGPCWSARCGA